MALASNRANTTMSTGLSRKLSVKGSAKIAGNDHASFHMLAQHLLNDDEESVDRSTMYRVGKVVPVQSSAKNLLNPRDRLLKKSQFRNRNKRLTVSGMTSNSSKKEEKDGEQAKVSQALNFWGSRDTHHVMPVFAAGRAFVPTAFDAVFIQSFFSSYTLPACEKFVSGDEAQLVMKIKVPNNFVERCYADLFRAMNTRGLLVLGLYRKAHPRNMAQLPYVFTNPPMNAVLHLGDHMYVFGHPVIVELAEKSISQPLQYMPDGRVSMARDKFS